jgi:hypothetical protein
LTVANVLRSYAGEYLAWRGEKASFQERRVLAQLTACRTAQMGGHAWHCDSCGAVRAAYDSCRNRHCPTCRGAARAKWLERVRDDLLPVPYFHVIQTLPHEPMLDRLVLANRRLLYGLLFRAVAEALLQLAADPRYLGARIGLLSVLHTWGQLIDTHVHVHLVVPGGGLSLDGTAWVSCGEEFFLPVQVIGSLFRGKFLAGLKRLWRKGKLSPLAEKRRFEPWLSTMYKKNWVAYAQGPPSGVVGAEPVLKYLARYVSGVAISDRRLVSDSGDRVAFRWKNYRRGRAEETTSLPGVEFVRRYLLHVLPRGLVRIRYYGLLSNRCRRHHLARCRALIGEPSNPAAAHWQHAPAVELAELKLLGRTEPPLCPSCRRGRLVLLETWPRASGWPRCSLTSESDVNERPMENTFEEFMAQRRPQPTTEPSRQSLRGDTS